jgi:hypothetical protein
MSKNLTQSMLPVASFIFENTSDVDVKMCLFSGHYDVSEVCSDAMTNPTKFDVRYTNVKVLQDAGFECDQIADDTSYCRVGISGANKVTVKGASKKIRFRDFINYIKLAGVNISKMRFTDLSTSANPSRAIFQQEMEISSSSIGAKSGSDFVQLSQHINPANFLQNFIEVDLATRNLLLDETTLAFLTIPANAKFQIDFTLVKHQQ